MPNDDDAQIILGFDVGLRYLGVGVGQTLTHTARPLSVLQVQQGDWPWSSLDKILKEWRPHLLLVGYPFNMDNSDGSIVPVAKSFGAQLEERYQLPVLFIDERLTTRAAMERLPPKQYTNRQRKKTIDSIAAQIIVEQYLTALKNQISIGKYNINSENSPKTE
jgi:putative Holliday junction resolvase